jgi:hypothetical protein
LIVTILIFLTKNVAAEEEKNLVLLETNLSCSISLQPDTTVMVQDIMQNIAGVDCMMH